jgi:hypothetical protein
MQRLRDRLAATLRRGSLFLVPVGFVVGCVSGLPPSTPSTVTAQPSTGTATLSWTRPTTNTNGSPLLNLAGYRISYGSSPAALEQSITVPDPAATSYTLQGLPSGTWYFAIAAVTTAGRSSILSAIVSKTIP